MAKQKLFKNLNPNFFNVLASPNKETYFECLMLIYDLLDNVENAFQGERDVVVQTLIQYFEDKELELINEGDFAETILTPRQKANKVLNYFKECGWLGEEELGDYKTSVNLFDYSIMFIEVLKAILEGEQFEYSGEIYVVYSLLKNFKVEEGVNIIEQALLQTNKITRRLRALKANIYRYYYNITKGKEQNELSEILDTLLVEYKNNFFDKAYYNLKTRDSLPRYKGLILKLLNDIYNDEIIMTQISQNAMRDKEIENFDDAYHLVEKNLREIRDSFNAFENLVNQIDIKNEQYISASAAKILFLTNRSANIEGILNRIIDVFINDKIPGFEYQKIFKLFDARNLDTESLYTARTYRVDTSQDDLVFANDFIDEEIIKKKLNLLMKNNIYSKKEINNLVIETLKDKNEILASEFVLENQEDLVKLVLIFLYSKSVAINYTCELINKEVKNNFVTFNDFIIKLRRTNKK